ncbi:GNAT family N-acetyltransferase [Lactococcus lactis]|uniref:GNAT family N-acetyltransferase n=1 Tax=Lactococcus lactis TaxID=1358 RepID=UPI00288E12C8|nr:GNAT family N-acetyltransferase [Lactococcus lactis]MDT2926294.1 GNAT family N-acetyltransferase [Lactococcus lactis]
MNLIFKSISKASNDLQLFNQINIDSFPEFERMEIDTILKFSTETASDFMGIYDNDFPIGFYFLVKNKNSGYIFYYAIDQRYRSKGYGSAALKKMIAQYKEIQLTLDFEQIDESSSNNEQRIRRKKFYLKNGLKETGHFTLLSGERFEIVCTEDEFDVNGLVEILKIIHPYCPEFPAVVL